MTREEAEKIISQISNTGAADLSILGPTVILNGHFTASELRAIAQILEDLDES